MILVVICMHIVLYTSTLLSTQHCLKSSVTHKQQLISCYFLKLPSDAGIDLEPAS